MVRQGFSREKSVSGEKFDQHDLIAAHPTLPMGTEATVTNLESGKSVEVTINDRGFYRKGVISIYQTKHRHSTGTLSLDRHTDSGLIGQNLIFFEILYSISSHLIYLLLLNCTLLLKGD